MNPAPHPVRATFWTLADGRLLGSIAVLYLLLVCVPGGYRPIEVGLDPSWMYGINALPLAGYHFGTDINFTYGPLGFLLAPVNLGQHIPEGIAFRALVHLIFAGLLLSRALRPGRFAQTLLFVFNYAASAAFYQVFELHLLVLCALAAWEATERRSVRGMAATALLSAPLALMKFSLCIGAVAILGMAALLWFTDGGARALGKAAIWLGCYAAALTVGAAITLGSPAAIRTWLHASLEIASDYSIAMCWIDVSHGPSTVGFGLALLVAYAGMAIWLGSRGGPIGRMLLLLLGPMFLAFKQGFVREDEHVFTFFAFLPAAAGLACLAAEGSKSVAAAALGTATAIACSFLGLQHRHLLSWQGMAAVLSTAPGRTNLGYAVHPTALRSGLDGAARDWLGPDRFPADLRALLGHESVGVLPAELTYCHANNLNCSPSPCLQLYQAYTSYLEDLTIEHYAGDRAPTFLLVDLLGIDGRHLVWDGGRLWRALLERYDAVREPTAHTPLVLRKRAVPVSLAPEVIGHATAHAHDWIEVPQVAGLLWAQIDMRLSSRGRLAKTFLRIPAVTASLESRGRGETDHRLIPATASDGLLLSDLPLDIGELANLFEGKPFGAVVRLMIQGPGAKYYEPTIQITWLKTNRR